MMEELGYTLHESAQVWHRQSFSDLNYSDGEAIENHLAEVIARANDLSVLSPELKAHCQCWTTRYHLSRMRANLLRPLAEILKGDILEIGAGCGAMTRYLGESGAEVLALEGTFRRASIARSRTRDLNNVTVLAERFDDFQPNKQYDLITLIGVLEYAGCFTSEPNPALSLLTKVRALLKPEGRLIIAIENQLGLKYFAGAPEDHVGKPMFGLEGRYQTGGVRTFGRSVLTELLKEAGFNTTEFLLPFPDYKLPTSVLTEHGLNHPDFDGATLACQAVKQDPQLPAKPHFMQELVWPEIFNNQLALDLANSFLVVSSPQAPTFMPKENLAFYYESTRLPILCKELQFIDKFSNGIEVQAHKLVPGSAHHYELDHISFRLDTVSPYIPGTMFSREFIQLVTQQNCPLDDLEYFFRRYLKLVSDFAEKEGYTIDLSDLNTILPGHFFDLIPRNIICDKMGAYHVIDQEWVLNQDLTLKYLLIRAVMDLTFHSIIPRDLMARLGLDPSSDEITSLLFTESRIQSEIMSEECPCYYFQIEQPRPKRRILGKIKSKIRSKVLRLVGVA